MEYMLGSISSQGSSLKWLSMDSEESERADWRWESQCSSGRGHGSENRLSSERVELDSESESCEVFFRASGAGGAGDAKAASILALTPALLGATSVAEGWGWVSMD